MKFFMFAASTSSTSLNKKLINLAAKIIKEAGHEVDLADFKEFDLPLYNADMDQKHGLPENAKKFIKRMQAADATIISSPEYNFSTPGTLKNLIDWVSRQSPYPWKNQQMLLMSASIAQIGGNRGLWATRVPLEACGALVFPEMFSLATAHQAFEANGELKNKDLLKRLKGNIEEFLNHIAVFKRK